jgi:hypothetical protein
MATVSLRTLVGVSTDQVHNIASGDILEFRIHTGSPINRLTLLDRNVQVHFSEAMRAFSNGRKKVVVEYASSADLLNAMRCAIQFCTSAGLPERCQELLRKAALALAGSRNVDPPLS